MDPLIRVAHTYLQPTQDIILSAHDGASVSDTPGHSPEPCVFNPSTTEIHFDSVFHELLEYGTGNNIAAPDSEDCSHFSFLQEDITLPHSYVQDFNDGGAGHQPILKSQYINTPESSLFVDDYGDEFSSRRASSWEASSSSTRSSSEHLIEPFNFLQHPADLKLESCQGGTIMIKTELPEAAPQFANITTTMDIFSLAHHNDSGNDETIIKAPTKRKKKPYRKKPKVVPEYVPILGELLKSKLYHRALQDTTAKKGYYRCSHCTMQFRNLLEYVRHMDQFSIERKYKCHDPDCPYRIIGFPRRAESRRHYASQHPVGPVRDTKRFVCGHENCEKSFPRKDSLKRHEKLCHLNEGSRFNQRMMKVNRKAGEGNKARGGSGKCTEDVGNRAKEEELERFMVDDPRFLNRF